MNDELAQEDLTWSKCIDFEILSILHCVNHQSTQSGCLAVQVTLTIHELFVNIRAIVPGVDKLLSVFA